MRIILTLLIGSIFSINTFCQTVPQLVSNINPNTVDVNSHSDPAKGNNPNYPDTGVFANGKFIFPARNYNGIEMWQTDGTSNGTNIIKDINSGYSYADANPMFLTKLNGSIYFFTADWDYNNNRFFNFRLRSMDTATGFISGGSLTNNPFDYVSNVVVSNGDIYFIGYNSNNNNNPYYTSDTSIIQYDPSQWEGYTIIAGGNPRELKTFGNNNLVFDADDGTNGRELWTYDITNQNAYMVLDINNTAPGASSNPHDFVTYNNQLYFTADDGAGAGMHLCYWDINNNFLSGATFAVNNPNPHDKIVYNNQLYFRVVDSANGSYDIYSYDANSLTINYVAPDYDSTNGPMAIANNLLFFSANDGNYGNELWYADTVGNIILTDDINGGGDANPINLTPLNNQLLFVADDGGGPQVWVTDGNNNISTQMVDPIQVNYNQNPPKIFGTDNNGFAYFYADDGTHGKELWRTDGTADNTSLVKDINLGDYSSIGSNIAGTDVYKGALYFGAYNGSTTDLYKADSLGSSATIAVSGAAAGFSGLYYSSDHVKAAGNYLFFDAFDAANVAGYELWRTDGTVGGTMLVKDINPGTNWSSPNQMQSCNGLLFFTADDGTNYRQLWRSDGTTSGTIMLSNINNNGDPSINNLTVVGNKVFFVATDIMHGTELWVSDGTLNGTSLVKDILPGVNSSNPGNLKTIDSLLYFSANDSLHGSEPWISDGTSAGTYLLKDINPGTGSSNPSDFTKLGSYVFMAADSLGGQNILWRTDGTSSGTHMFDAIASFPFNLTNIGNKITFLCDPQGATLGFEWWTTDGSIAGTKQLTNFAPYGVGYYFFGDNFGFKNHGFTYADDGLHGMELWQTDGTPAGTFVNDLAVGNLSSYPTNLKGLDPMFFTADDGTSIGYELWKINVSASVSWLNFTATLHDTTQAFLQWQTANENNNKGFIVQRSFDGITYDSIGFVPAGSPNGATYSFIDSFPHVDSNYYRLQQINLSGIIEYSNIEVVFIKKPLTGGIVISSEILCTGIQPTDIVDSIPASGGNISSCYLPSLGIDPKFCYTYKWQDSILNGTWQDAVPAGANPTYFFYSGALNTTTYFRRKVYDENNDSAYSNIIAKVYNTIGDTSIAPNDAWNVYLFGGNDISLANPITSGYYGYYSDTTTQDYNTQKDWSPVASPSSAPNYQGCSFQRTNTYGYFNPFTIVLKRSGFTPGNYVLNLIQYTSSVRVFVNHIQVFDAAVNYVGGSTPIVSLGALNANSIVEIRMVYQPYNDYNLLNFSFYLSNLQAGIIIGNQTACASQTPSQLGTIQDAYGGPAPSNISYQWQDSISGGAWQNIASANSDTYQPPGLSDTTFFRRIALDGISSPVYSDTITINTITVTQTPVVFQAGRVLSINAISGANAYKWFRNGTLISGAIGLTYTATLAGSYTAKYTMNCGDGPASNAVVFASDALSQTINYQQQSDVPYGPYETIILNASSTSGLPVQFSLISGPAVVSNDTAFILGTGIVTIQASQPGNTTYSPAPLVLQSFNVTLANQTISFTSIPPKNYGDVPFVLQATSSSGLPVTYSIVSGPATSYGYSTIVIKGAGIIVVKASQGGNGNYNAAPDVLDSVCVGVSTVGAITGDTSVCPNTTVYSVTQINGASYQWGITGGGILTPNGASATVQWQTPGIYTISVQGYSSCNTGRSAPSNLNIVVNNVTPPGAVTNMLPTDGTVNLQLPLTLSWIPGTLTKSFDLYIWNADSSQPAAPFATGITTVSYTLSNKGLPYHQSYKWMIVSHSTCGVTNGPVQTFSLIPLPDLVVSKVLAPKTAFSGQQISITWTVTNIGPGRTNVNQNWTDAVFLSTDSTPDLIDPPYVSAGVWNRFVLPLRPLMIGAVPNLTALDSGQSYTNTVNFTLPLNYSWPLYAYVITNYSPGATAPYEVSLANDTAHAPDSILVTLSPIPDLRVDSVLTPTSTFSGSTINVFYKVKNYGVTTPPNTGWIDNVYISKDPFFDKNTATLLTQPKYNGTYFYNPPNATFYNSNQLQQDSFYDNLVTVVIPNDIYGTYFIYVYTDAGNAVYEGSVENNNTGNNQIQVFLTPTPILTVSSLSTNVSSASTTQSVGINWNIKNQGYYDNIEKNQGHYLETLIHCPICYIPYCPPPPPPDPCYYQGTCTYNYTCPKPASGYTVQDSLSWGSSYWNDYVYLSTDSNSLNINKAIYLGAYTYDLLGHGMNYDNSTSLPGIYNGTGISDAEASSLSSFNVNTLTAIKPGSIFSGALYFNMPDTLSQGNYYVYVLANADSSVFEYPSQFQTKRSAAIFVARPDLIVPSVTVPATCTAGQTISINYTVLNSGPGSVYLHYRKDNIYMSSSPVFDATAQLIASQVYSENIPVNIPITHQAVYNVPIGISGNRYFYVITNADSSFRETNQTNNLSTTNAQTSIIAAPPSDLYVSSIVVPDTVYSIFGFPFKYTVPNQGVGTTFGSWTDSIFISCSATWDRTSAFVIATRIHNNILTTGTNYVDSFNISIPFTYNISYSCFPLNNNAVAYFYVKTNSDNGTYEGTNTNNNVLGTTSIAVINPLPDHIVTSVKADTNATVGRNYSASWTVQNLGLNPGYAYYNTWADGLFFSPDSVFDNNAVYGGNLGENSPLNTNQTYSSSSSNFIVPNIPAGNYYVFINTNYGGHWFNESNFNNNTNLVRSTNGNAQLVHVVAPLLPDLTDTIVSSPASSAVGQPITIVYTVTNNGPGVTYPATWGDQFWLSNDYIPGNGGDIYLGSFNHSGALQPGQSYTDTVTLPVNLYMPPGNYVLIAQTNNSGYVFETNKNNNLSFSYITIFSPAPSDLTVTNILHPDTVYLGYPDTTTWSIANISPNLAKGIESDGVYLSKSNVLDSTAVLLGTKMNSLNLFALTKDTFSLYPLLSGVAEGSYYVLVKTDILNNMVETNKDNNVGVSAKQVYVKVKQLPLNVSTAATLINENVYYKLVIPDSLLGSTLYVTLMSNDSLTVTNQVYIGGGYVPSASHFDYEYNNPNAGNQQILMSSVTDSVYYITLTCVTPDPPVQNIALLAVKLPFAVLNVNSNQGGNTGNVTVSLTGSLFVNNMKATLYSSALNKTINASAVYFVNSTSAYATFNLAGEPLGTYDVNLIKPDSTFATLPQSFSIVAANNGGLITGTGVNQGQSGSSNAPGCDPGATSGLNAQLQTEMVIPPNALIGAPFQFIINYSNPTNVDIAAQTRILYSENGLPIAFTPAGLSAGATSLYIQFTEQNGPPGIIRAGGSGSITIYVFVPNNKPAHSDAYFNLK